MSFGRFRPLPRTDGLWIVYDPDLPFAKRTVAGKTFEDREKCFNFARALFLQDPLV